MYEDIANKHDKAFYTYERAGGYMGEINREDMLELTRRMTLKRNCFDRIAGAYMDEEGFVDGTFNRHFQRLSEKDRQINLDIAKTIPFSETNVQLKEYGFVEANRKAGSRNAASCFRHSGTGAAMYRGLIFSVQKGNSRRRED